MTEKIIETYTDSGELATAAGARLVAGRIDVSSLDLDALVEQGAA